MEAGIGVLRRPKAGEHPHRPQPPPVAGGVDAAGEGRLARHAEVAIGMLSGQVGGGVEAPDLDPRLGREAWLALGTWGVAHAEILRGSYG